MSELNGFYENMPYEEYAKIDALNGSSIVHMRRSPLKYRHMKDNPQPPSPAMALGIIKHRMVLEPALMEEIAVWGLKEEEKVRNGNVWNAFQEAHAGKLILTKAEYEETTSVARAALLSPLINKYVSADGPTEVSMFWRHPHTGRRMKARLDKLITETIPGRPDISVLHDRIKQRHLPTKKYTVMDLKSTRDCTSYRFGAQAAQLGYHIKMAIQYEGVLTLTGCEPEMRLAPIESKPPYECALYRVPKDVILQGLEEKDNLIAKLDECEASNQWPPEQDCETDLILPAWSMSSPLDELVEV
jgi:PDDEXK-like domain of unknown function (DUF3799)